jgi:hypothetical protein
MASELALARSRGGVGDQQARRRLRGLEAAVAWRRWRVPSEGSAAVAGARARADLFRPAEELDSDSHPARAAAELHVVTRGCFIAGRLWFSYGATSRSSRGAASTW